MDSCQNIWTNSSEGPPFFFQPYVFVSASFYLFRLSIYNINIPPIQLLIGRRTNNTIQGFYLPFCWVHPPNDIKCPSFVERQYNQKSFRKSYIRITEK